MSLGEEVRARVRRFAVLRAAQRMLADAFESPRRLETALEEGRELLERLRRFDGSAAPGAEELAEIDALLDRQSASFHAALATTSARDLCDALRRTGDSEPTALRALGAALLEGDLRQDATLRLIEAAVTSLACHGARGERRVVRKPAEALPELEGVGAGIASEEDVREATRIFGRAIERIEADDPDASRTRIRTYKERIGAKLLHPDILAAAVAYNAAMGNRMAQLARRERDELTETLLGRENLATPRSNTVAARASVRATQSPRANAMNSSLLWTSAVVVGLAIGCLLLASAMWPDGSAQRPSPELSAGISPFVASGYVSRSDQRPRFVGTVSADWADLDLVQREQTLTSLSSRLLEHGVRDVILVDASSAIQARHDGARIWVKPPSETAP